MSVRFARLERSVFYAVAELVPASIRDPRVHVPEALVVTKVKVSGDLSVARVVVTIKGDAAVQEEAMAALRGAAGHIRRKLGQRVALRRVPQIAFVLDETPEKAARVEEILRELAEERRAREEEETPEGDPPEEDLSEEAGEGADVA